MLCPVSRPDAYEFEGLWIVERGRRDFEFACHLLVVRADKIYVVCL